MALPYKRKTILVNKPFQLKMSFILASWIIALSFVYPWVVFSLFDNLAESIRHPLLEEVKSILIAQNDVIYTQVVLLYLSLAVLTFLLSLVVSHKIAGPLSKLKEALGQVKDGNINHKIYFRKSDYFKDLANDFNKMTSSLSKDKVQSKGASLSRQIKKLEELSAELGEDQKKTLEGILVELKKND